MPTYAKVRYESVYPGVDLIYYGNQQQLEYDFVVAPHANPSAIVFALETGKSKLETHIVPNGDLVVKTDGGEVRFHKPVVYQLADSDRKLIDGRYSLDVQNRVRFQVGAYDHSRQLVIDSVLSYSTYLGGSNLDYAYGIAVDSFGNAYVTGQTDSLDFPLMGQVQGSGGGTCSDPLNNPFPCFDAFVAKLDPTGSRLIYATFLGGSGDDHGTGIAVDSGGNAYVTGYTVSTDFPTVSAFQANFGGGNCGQGLACMDTFVAKLNAAGSAISYSTYLGGTGNDIASGIAVDASGAAYVVGSTSSADFPVTSQPLQAALGGGTYNAFITKLAPAGSTAAYSTYLGGSGEDHGAAIAVDIFGHAYVTGYTNSNNFPTMIPFQPSSGGGTCGMSPCFDAFIAKLNSTGSALVYSTYFGGSGGDYGYGIAVNAVGNAYVTGLTTSTNLPVNSGAYLTTGQGTSYDAYVMKMNFAGSALVYSTYLGGISSEVGNGIAVDSSGNAYVTGYAYGQGFPIASPLQPLNNFLNDAFVTKLNAAGAALIFSTYLGGSGNDVGQGIAVDSSGNVFVAGGTFSTDFPVTSGSLKTSYGGGAYNAFVARISNLFLPVCALSQASVTFPGQGVGTTSLPSIVALVNQGDAALTLSSIAASGDFAVTHDCGSSVVPGASCSLSITSTPTVIGPRFGNVTITDNAWGSPHVLSLAGNGISTPIVSLSPSSLTFGQQPVGATSPAQQVTLTNTGSGTLNVNSIAVSGSFSQSNNCSAVILAGGGCTLQVTFSPTSRGTFASQVTISDNAPGSPHAVILTGVSSKLDVSLSSTALSFGNWLLGAASSSQTVTLTSSGDIGLTISSIVASGDFSQTNNCGSWVAVGASCTINATFTATAGGPRRSSISISDNAAGSPQMIILTGVGMAANLSPGSLNFPNLTVGAASAPQTITLTNVGSTAMNVWQIVIMGSNAADFSKISTCGSALGAGKQCTIGVTFTPSAPGTKTASLWVSDDGGGSPQAVSLSGTGLAGTSASHSASAASFGKHAAGAIVPAQTITLGPWGPWPVTAPRIPAHGDSAKTRNCLGPVEAEPPDRQPVSSHLPSKPPPAGCRTASR